MTTNVMHRTELQEAIQAAVDGGFAGVQLRVHDAQRGEWVGSAGVHKLGESEPPNVNGHFWVGSSTKTFVATLVLKMVDDGALDLDSPVGELLPEYGIDERITVRMLLQHTSGLFNYTGEPRPDGTFEMRIASNGKDWVENRLHSYRVEELVRISLAEPLKFEPGTEFSYSNSNYALAVLLIEKLTGSTYAEVMEQRILGPLGLKNTLVPGNDSELPAPYAHGYCRYQDGEEWKTDDVSRQNSTILIGAGDMISTTRDLQVFISALMGGKLLSAELMEEMRKPYGPLGYGLGLFVQEVGEGPDGTIYHHNGGAPGGYGALMYSSADGSRALSAGLTMGDADINPALEFPKLVARLIELVFADDSAA
ncbi:serine hydrolase domain-containing protein [Streptomyces sp. NPDC051561]|uniref:serine hydrolase domain-containing protein n=1 Tax=Streptomyces sp. NPDC051561 TaxID=3365658 RepID=UPI00379C6E19